MSSAAIADADHVLRYCKPSTVQYGMPIVGAFQLRDGESSLSVNWLEFLDANDRANAVQLVRNTFDRKKFTRRPKGCFAAINVGDGKQAVEAIGLDPLDIDHDPMPGDESHTLISGYDTSNDLDVAAELCALVQSSDVYGAVVP